jgi:transcription antitermination factor NusA-like protein
MDYTYGQSNDYPLRYINNFLKKKLFINEFYSNRILVPSDSVGAIIGKQGSTVKQIKQATHAKYSFLKE